MSTIWEVRPTVGSDTNGGAFVAGASGTDFSQQNSKNSSGNNISTTDVVATGVATITSATASFTSAIVGNIIYLAGSGITTGWYQAVTYTNATTVVLDRSPGTGTGATMNIGGALATLTPYVDNLQNVSGGNIAYVQASGTLTITSTIGSLGESTVIIGYGTVRGDGGQATITTATDSVAIFTVGNTAAYSFYNLILTNSAGTPAPALSWVNADYTVQVSLINCVVDGCSTLTNIQSGNVLIDPLLLDACEIKNCTGSGIDSSYDVGIVMLILACYIHDNATDGLRSYSQSGTYLIQRCAFAGNTVGVYIGGAGGTTNSMTMLNCALFDNSSDGLKLQDLGTEVIWNTILDANGGYGINQLNSSFTADVRNCAFYNNTSGQYTGVTTTGDVTLSGDPFVNASGGNFSLNSTSGAGLSCQGSGYPAILP